MDMQATHDTDAHHLPSNETPSFAKTLEVNNLVIFIRLEQVDSTIRKIR
jgi:hypothetical protein